MLTSTRENFHKIKNHARIFMRKDFYLKSNVKNFLMEEFLKSIKKLCFSLIILCLANSIFAGNAFIRNLTKDLNSASNSCLVLQNLTYKKTLPKLGEFFCVLKF